MFVSKDLLNPSYLCLKDEKEEWQNYQANWELKLQQLMHLTCSLQDLIKYIKFICLIWRASVCFFLIAPSSIAWSKKAKPQMKQWHIPFLLFFSFLFLFQMMENCPLMNSKLTLLMEFWVEKNCMNFFTQSIHTILSKCPLLTIKVILSAPENGKKTSGRF